MLFEDRAEVGRQLATRLLRYKDERPVVLGLPRGGVPVAYQIARALDAPLDVIVVAGSYLYFEAGVLDSMYELGLRAATKWLAVGPVVDHLDEPPSPPAASPTPDATTPDRSVAIGGRKRRAMSDGTGNAGEQMGD